MAMSRASQMAQVDGLKVPNPLKAEGGSQAA
jgi:hypothetical protein